MSQQAQRSAAGNAMYRQQEVWLERFLARRAAELGRPLKVLDFGCGFGRMTRFLADNQNVVYHGYDFSEPMTAPLRAEPPGNVDPANIRVANTANEAFPGETFDFIFTIAVLIHNEPGNARTLVWNMLEQLAEGGRLCLMENMLASFSMRENNWHGGCWVHDHVGPYAPLWNIDLYRGVVHEQDIYVYGRPDEGVAAETAVIDDREVRRVITRDEHLLLGLPRIEAAARGLESEVASFAAEQAVIHDAAEDNRRWQGQLDEVNEKLRQADVERASLVAVQSLRKRVEAAMLGHEAEPAAQDIRDAEQNDRPHLIAPTEGAASAPYLWNAARDTEFADVDVRFDRVCHVFHQEWIGIRAAAGALPGRKLAISASHALTAYDVNAVLSLLRTAAVDRVVVHGFSPAMEAFIRAIHGAGFEHINMVWHGAAAMWVFEGERDLAKAALQLVRKGIVRRMQGMRRGMDEVIGSRAYAPLLFNVAPKLAPPHLAAPKRNKGAIVFSPSWNLLHKNLVSNLLAAQFNDRVGEIWTVAQDLDLGRSLSSKLRHLGPRNGRAMLETMRQADIITNVTIVDCHPMVDQEALAVGVPCLRGPLFLDAYEDHPYVALTEVSNPLSVGDISKAMSRVLDVPHVEMSALIVDYAGNIRATSYERYFEFLEIN
jgi:SAM-dependent methyltransferase